MEVDGVMRILGAILIIIFMIVLCIIAIKISYWIEKIDKKTDKYLYGFETDDYKVNRQLRIAAIIIFFIITTIGLIVLYFKH